MFLKLVLLFTLIPLTELYILMQLGAHFGVGITLFVVIGTGVLGAYLAKREGYRILFRMQQEMNAGRMPASQMIDGLLVFAAGVVLLTPGLLTDILGFFILFPYTRSIVKQWIMTKVSDAMQRGGGHTDIRYFRRDE